MNLSPPVSEVQPVLLPESWRFSSVLSSAFPASAPELPLVSGVLPCVAGSVCAFPPVEGQSFRLCPAADSSAGEGEVAASAEERELFLVSAGMRPRMSRHSGTGLPDTLFPRVPH